MFSSLNYGWCPDLADSQDWEFDEIPECNFENTAVDLSSEFAQDLESMNRCYGDMSCAFSVITLAESIWRRSEGKSLDASPEFLHQMTQRTFGGGGALGVSLRLCIKALRRFGAPPSRLLRTSDGPITNRPELFCFSRHFESLGYVRLDGWRSGHSQHLSVIRKWISQGNLCTIGFAVPSTIDVTHSREIPLDIGRGGTVAGTAGIVVGFDDQFELICSARHPLVSPQWRNQGAFLLKTTWEKAIGSGGYVWLPYAFVEARSASSAWGFFCNRDSPLASRFKPFHSR